LNDARTKIPLAGWAVPIHELAVLSMRTLDTQGRTNLTGHTRLHIKESKQMWSLKHPSQKSVRALRVHVTLILWKFAWVTAYRWPCEQEESGGEAAG